MPKADDHIRHTVSFKPDLDTRMSARIEQGGFSSVSEYIRHAVREDLNRTERDNVERLLIDGLGNGDSDVRERIKKAMERR